MDLTADPIPTDAQPTPPTTIDVLTDAVANRLAQAAGDPSTNVVDLAQSFRLFTEGLSNLDRFAAIPPAIADDDTD